VWTNSEGRSGGFFTTMEIESLRKGLFINAMKLYKERTGADLVTSKAEIEDLADAMGLMKVTRCPHCGGTGGRRSFDFDKATRLLNEDSVGA